MIRLNITLDNASVSDQVDLLQMTCEKEKLQKNPMVGMLACVWMAVYPKQLGER